VSLRERVAEDEVRVFADEVGEALDRPPRPGRVVPADRVLWVEPGVAGVEVDRERLARLVEVALRNPVVPRVLTFPAGHPRPGSVEEQARAAVDRLARRVDRPARNARVVPTATGLRVVAARPGAFVDRERLLGSALAAAAGRTPVALEPPLAPVQPRVRLRDLPRRYPVYLTLSQTQRQLRLYRNLRLVRTYRVAVGTPSWPTPNGLFRIVNKAINPAWSVPLSSWTGSLAGRVIPGGAPDNPLKARWLGFYNGAGIHGTADVGSLGGAASHGCVRMAVDDVIDLYERVPVATPLYIAY
jgi:lipoprotein-anchoring transpeptidase ErfK/SrfK